MNKLLYGLLLIFTLCRVNAQEEPPELITDRPDQTESSSVIPFRSLQIETGFVLENNSADDFQYKGYAYNATLLRYGLLENLELRLGLAYMGEEWKFNTPDSLSTIKGLSPLLSGFKIQICREKGLIPEIAFIGGLSLPFVAGEDLRSDYTAGIMRLSVSHSLSDVFSFGYNLGVEWDGESAAPAFFYTVVMGIGITNKLGAFVEGFGSLPEKSPASHLLHAGLTFLLLQNLQLDLSGGLGLNEKAMDNFLSCGLSWRLPR
jgi:hypothetical protein